MSKRLKERASPEEIRERRIKAKNSPDILTIGICDAMKKFKLNYRNIVEIRRNLIEEKLRAGNSEELIEVNRQRANTLLRGRVLNTENKYPMIHRKIINSRFMASVASQYGITRERVRQIRNQFYELVDVSNKTVKSLLDEVEEESKK